jgi:hypothetical protein
VRSHQAGVALGGQRKRNVAMQRRKTKRGALLVGGGEQVLLGQRSGFRGTIGCWRGGCNRREEQDEGKESREAGHNLNL